MIRFNNKATDSYIIYSVDSSGAFVWYLTKIVRSYRSTGPRPLAMRLTGHTCVCRAWIFYCLLIYDFEQFTTFAV